MSRARRGVNCLQQDIEACRRHDLALHAGIFAASGKVMLAETLVLLLVIFIPGLASWIPHYFLG